MSENEKIIPTSIECPGSIAANGINNHNLITVGQGEKKICINGKCYFMYLDVKNVGWWQTGFDPTNAKSFVKISSEKVMK